MTRVLQKRARLWSQRRGHFPNAFETPNLSPGTGIKISEKIAVKSGTKLIAIRDQATTECFFRSVTKNSFLMKKS